MININNNNYKNLNNSNSSSNIDIDKFERGNILSSSASISLLSNSNTMSSSLSSSSSLSNSLSSSTATVTSQKLKGFNYKDKEQYIISRVANGKLFDNRMPPQLAPFIEEQEFTLVIDSINNYVPRKEIFFNKILFAHLGIFIFFIICLSISGWRKKIPPIIIIVILCILLFISLYIVYKQVKPRHVKKEIGEYHRQLTRKYRERGLIFKCTLVTSNRKKYYRYIHVNQTSIIIYYPKKEDEQAVTIPTTTSSSPLDQSTIEIPITLG